jgi:uncharacterized protein YidB (DUF937 family)
MLFKLKNNKMEELIKLVAKKAGINETVAQIAVTTVISNLKSKLPAGVGSILDSFLGSGSATATKSKTTVVKSKPTASKSKTTASKTTKATKNNDILGGVGGVIGELSKIFKK